MATTLNKLYDEAAHLNGRVKKGEVFIAAHPHDIRNKCLLRDLKVQKARATDGFVKALGEYERLFDLGLTDQEAQEDCVKGL